MYVLLAFHAAQLKFSQFYLHTRMDSVLPKPKSGLLN